jgi:hypothetical protein
MWCDVPEEESHCGETACDDDKVGFDEAGEGHVSTCDDDDISDSSKTYIQIPGMTIAHV